MSYYFPVDYREVYASQKPAGPGKKKIVTQRDVPDFYAANIAIDTVDYYFTVISRICGRTFDISSVTKMRAFLLQVQQELMLRADLSSDTTFYSFLRANRPSSLYFRIYCRYDYRRTMEEVARLCATERERREICKMYKLGLECRSDMLSINVLYHLMYFMQQFSDRNINLLELVKCYYKKSERLNYQLNGGSGSEPSCCKSLEHTPSVYIRSGTFTAIYNYIAKPRTECRSPSDVVRDLRCVCELAQQLGAQACSIKTFVIGLKLPICDCNFDIYNFVVSRSVEEVWQVCVGEKLQSDDYRNLSVAYYRMMKEVFGYLCCLRNWAIYALEAANKANYQREASLEDLLTEVIAIAYKHAENRVLSYQAFDANLQLSKSPSYSVDDVYELRAADQVYYNEDIVELKQMCRSLIEKQYVLQEQNQALRQRVEALERRVSGVEKAVF